MASPDIENTCVANRKQCVELLAMAGRVNKWVSLLLLYQYGPVWITWVVVHSQYLEIIFGSDKGCCEICGKLCYRTYGERIKH